jgi:hypothetical protein
MATNFRLNGTTASQFAEDNSVLFPTTIYQPIGPREGGIVGSTTLTDAQLRQARDTMLFINTTDEVTLVVGGADSASEAQRLQSVLGLVNQGDQCLLKFGWSKADFPANTFLKNSEETTGTYVKTRYYGTIPAGEDDMLLFDSDSADERSVGSLALVEVTAETTTPGAETIVFDIVCTATPRE